MSDKLSGSLCSSFFAGKKEIDIKGEEEDG